jgi:hypothetical protein
VYDRSIERWRVPPVIEVEYKPRHHQTPADRLSCAGDDGNDATLTALDEPPIVAPIGRQRIPENGTLTILRRSRRSADRAGGNRDLVR